MTEFELTNANGKKVNLVNPDTNFADNHQVDVSKLRGTYDIDSLPEKVNLAATDLLLLADSEDDFNLKKVAKSTLLRNPEDYSGPYGFNWDYTSDTYFRTGASGYKSIQSMMKRCVLNANGTVNYYLHPDNSNFKADGTPAVLTGADGNVMVEIPKFYAKIETEGTVNKSSIALTPEPGYVVHPAFIKAGVEVDFRYYRAYEGFLSGGKLVSVSGVTPTRSQTRATFRNQAVANGAGWHLTDWNLLSAIKLLISIEFCDFIVSKYLGEGNYDGTDHGRITGLSNSLGNRSSSSPNTTFMSYRGIEDFYANDWEFVDGLNVNNYGFYVNGNYTTFLDDVFTGNYILKGTCAAAASATYIKKQQVTVDGGYIPTIVGGASNTYYGDGFWSVTGARVALFGGYADLGALDGAFCLSVSNASSYLNVNVGAGVSF